MGKLVKIKVIPMLVVFVIQIFATRGEYFNKLEYHKMPRLFHLEDYDECLVYPTGAYCIVDILITTDKPSEVYDFVKNYSANDLKHFRHDILHRGICLSKRCNATNEELMEIRKDKNKRQAMLDICAVRDIQNEYDLGGNVTEINCNFHGEERAQIKLEDWIVAFIFMAIIFTNILCTTIHLKAIKDGKKIGKYASSFSMLSNARKIMSCEVTNNSTIKTDGVQGMRFYTMCCVILAHVPLLFCHAFLKNPEYIEYSYNDPMMAFFLNGNLLIQTFFVISSFLMVFSFLEYIEKNKKFDITLMPLLIIQRILRLLPVYMLTIAFISTWFEKMSYGPLWESVVGKEVKSCRKLWWTNLIFMNTVIGEGYKCLPQTWYIATDTQLFVLITVIMMIIWKFPNMAKFLLGSGLIISIILPGVLTYKYDYFPIQQQQPEAYRIAYADQPTFTYIYSVVEGNMCGYMIGAIGAYSLYFMRKNKIIIKDIWYKIFEFLAVAIGVSLILSGGIFYLDNLEIHPIIRAIYAAFCKPLFATLITFFLIALANEKIPINRKMIEFIPVRVLGRLSYCALFTHTIIQRGFFGIARDDIYLTDYYVLIMSLASIFLSFMTGAILCILVEMPFYNIQKMIFKSKKNKPENKETNLNGTLNNKNGDVSLTIDKSRL